MEALELPQIKVEKEGSSLKILSVSGDEGMSMPLHHSTREAVVICQNGSAVLNMNDKDHYIEEGGSIIIPAHAIHNLTTGAGFRALVVMDIKSAIIFEKN